MGYGRTHKQIKCIAESVAAKRKGNAKGKVTFKWVVAEISGKKPYHFSVNFTFKQSRERVNFLDESGAQDTHNCFTCEAH